MAVGDELLAGEGETDFDCIENDIDERLDTTEVEIVKALRKIDRKRAESRLLFRNPWPVWSPAEKLMRKVRIRKNPTKLPHGGHCVAVFLSCSNDIADLLKMKI